MLTELTIGICLQHKTYTFFKVRYCIMRIEILLLIWQESKLAWLGMGTDLNHTSEIYAYTRPWQGLGNPDTSSYYPGCVNNDGTQYPLDILICATGFETSYRLTFPVIGPGDKNLQDVGTKEPKGYVALAAPDFPNYFIFVGPNNLAASGPLLPIIGNEIFAWQSLSFS